MFTRLIFILVLTILIISSYSFAANPISLRLVYSTSDRTALRAIIEKHKDNRSIILECESDQFYRSSAVDLNENSPTEITFEIKLDSGAYSCRARLLRSNGDRFSAQDKFFVR